jgi:DNA-binding transcriptional ArsR family regulator
MNVALLQDKAASASELLKVLANETRLLILCQLIDGEKPVNELEELVGIRQSALSQHLAILRRERLVKTRRQAQYIYYSLASDEAKMIMNALYQIYCAPKKKAR